MKFRITGDICHSGVVVIEADSEDALVEMLTDDDNTPAGPTIYTDEFEIDDEQKADAFRWDGGEIEVAES
jgi:hypothetical protein